MIKINCKKCNKEILRNPGFILKNGGEVLCNKCKVEQTLIQKYGSLEEGKKLMHQARVAGLIKKYGVVNSSQLKWVQEEKEKNCLEKYGVKRPQQRKEIIEKMKNTCKKKYGGNAPYSSKEIQNKGKKTMQNNYGVDYALQNGDINKKQRDTMISRYGVENAGQSGEIHKKVAEKNMKNLGVEMPFLSKEIQDKCRKTYKERTGFEYPLQNIEVKKKIIERFGSIGTNIFCGGYRYNDIHFDSSYELAYYIWLTNTGKQFIYHPKFSFEYTGDDGQQHLYLPDFLIEGKFYEIKGAQFFRNGEPYNHYTKTYWWDKYDTMKKYDVTILREADVKEAFEFVKNNYGKDFLKSCKQRKLPEK
jgi:hypothetical protein